MIDEDFEEEESEESEEREEKEENEEKEIIRLPFISLREMTRNELKRLFFLFVR